MIALISDIHANFEALCAVMGDIKNHEVDVVHCLGDIVGYGPDPEKCTDLVMQETRISILGNHDFALLNVPIGFNPIAAEVIRKTQDMMRPGKTDARPKGFAERQYYACMTREAVPRCIIMERSKPERWEFMKTLPEKSEQGDVLYVHGSPLDPVFEYVFPDLFETTWDPHRLQKLFAEVRRVSFCGHTHIPCAIDSDIECLYPPECDYHLALDRHKKYIINIGSVGQPRDKDNRACYVLFDEKEWNIEWRRVPYDIESTVRKSDALCGEGNWCGARLRLGK
ncbi:MAG: fructose-bisphosphatase class III [Chitinispirillaceae bacterium]|nr:fructose-bisphosphatase class III [Chitinispirillaceae bacterium]